MKRYSKSIIYTAWVIAGSFLLEVLRVVLGWEIETWWERSTRDENGSLVLPEAPIMLDIPPTTASLVGASIVLIVWFATEYVRIRRSKTHASEEDDGQEKQTDRHPQHQFPPANVEAFILHKDDDPNRIWLHWVSPTSSSLLKIGLDIKRQGQGESGMLLSEHPATTKGQEITTLLCERGEDGQWFWASKHQGSIPRQPIKCYFTVVDDKDRRWHWGFALPARSEVTEEPKIVGDDIYLMSQRKMF